MKPVKQNNSTSSVMFLQYCIKSFTLSQKVRVQEKIRIKKKYLRNRIKDQGKGVKYMEEVIFNQCTQNFSVSGKIKQDPL